MRPVLSLFLAASLLALPLTAEAGERLKGDWLGTLDVGGAKLRIGLHFKAGDEGMTGTLDSLDQGAMGIPLAEIRLEGRALSFTVPSARARYAGTFREDGELIEGAWEQSGQRFDLNFRRGGAAPRRRPQTPEGAAPYVSEEVRFGHGEVELAGTLTKPKGPGPFPGLVLVSGSGPQDRDETILGHKPFAVIADHLSRRGFAVLRFDDRGVGGSTGERFPVATTRDNADDATAAFDYLRGRADIDGWKVGLAGHSEGGVIVPMVAARRPQVGFLVLLAGTGVTGAEILALQTQLIQEAAGVPEEVRARNKVINGRCIAIMVGEGSLEEKQAAMVEVMREGLADLSEEEKGQLGDMEVFIKRQVGSLAHPWMEQFLKMDPREALREVRCPVLALNGSLDLQVDARQNLPEILEALTEGGNGDVTAVLLPKLNHMFQRCETGSPSRYGEIETTMEPEVLELMTEWLTRKAAGLTRKPRLY